MGKYLQVEDCVEDCVGDIESLAIAVLGKMVFCKRPAQNIPMYW
jgi:hypothetical protein